MSGLGTVLLEAEAPVPVGTGGDPLRRLGAFAHRYASAKVVAGVGILAGFAFMGVFGPLLVAGNPTQPTGASLVPPSATHWLGTTLQGQDVLTQLVDGTASSLEVGFVAGALATAVAVAVGLVAGYLRGLSGELFSAVSNVFLVVPSLPLIIVLAGYLPRSGFLSITLVIAVTSWAGGARLIRAQTLAMVQRDFVTSAKAIGEPRRRILAAEILPNLLTIVMSTLLWAVIGAIAAEAGLAFLGLGNVNQVSWGYMINLAEANDSLLAGAWWWWLPPALCYALVGAALALINFGIDEVGNPRLRMVRLAARADKAAGVLEGPGQPTTPAAEPVAATATARAGAEASVPEGDVLLEVRDLSVGYLTPEGTVTAVDRVSFTLRRGEVLGVAGESGSGKSTMANAVTRLVAPPGVVLGGSVLYHGRSTVDLLSLSTAALREMRWEQVAVVFQSAMNALNPVLTIEAQLRDAITAHRSGTTRREARSRMDEMLTLVGVPASRASSYPHELSGGMRQRVSIAMALMLQPELVVLDEPTTGLDVVVQRAILERLLSLRAQLGFSVIFITHDLSLLLETCDSAMVMYAGRTVEIAGTADLHGDPLHPYSRRLRDAFPPLDGPRERRGGIPGSPPDPAHPVGGCDFHPRCDRAFAPCPGTEPALLQVGRRQVRCHLYDPACAPGSSAAAGPEREGRQEACAGGPDLPRDDGSEARAPEALPPGDQAAPLLECRNLSVEYRLQQGRHKTVHAVDDVSLSVRSGEVTAIVGESGCGKSSLLRALSLLGPVSGGTVLLRGKPVDTSHGDARYRSSVQLVFQDPFASMNPTRTVAHHVARALALHGGGKGRSELDGGVDRLLRRVSLSPPSRFAARYPHELSGGQRQRVMIARALGAGPAVLLADEPVSMLDVSIQLDVLNLLVDLAKEEQLGLVYVTHNLASARYAADTISVMYAGSIIESGPAVQVTQQPAHPYTRLLLRCTPRPRGAAAGDTVPAEDTGEPPNLVSPPSGCRFHPRCPFAMPVCRESAPPAFDAGPHQWAACWLLDPSAPAGDGTATADGDASLTGQQPSQAQRSNSANQA